MNPTAIVAVVLGVLILFFGRRLFWLFVAAVGFAVGFQLTPYLMQHPPVWLGLFFAILLGLIGAVLAFVLQKVAIAAAGFIVGGYVATALVAAFVTTHASYSGITFVIGGILGAIVMLLLFDWALIIFSAIAGAQLIATNLHLPATGTQVLFFVLMILGGVAQSAMYLHRRRHRPI